MTIKKILPYIVCFLVTLIFSIHYIVAKEVLNSGIPPLLLASTRGVFGGLLILFIFRKKIDITLIKENLWSLLCIGLFGFCLNQYLFMNGLTLSTPLHAAIISNSIPILTLLISLAFKTEKATFSKVLGIIIAFSLVTSLLFFNITFVSAEFLNFGNLLIFLNVLCFSFSFVWSKKLLQRGFPFEILTGFMLLIGGLVLLCFSIKDTGLLLDYLAEGPKEISIMLFEVFISTSLVYALNTWTASKLDVSVVTYFIYFQPILTALGGFVLFQSVPSLGSVFIYLGVMLSGILVIKK